MISWLCNAFMNVPSHCECLSSRTAQRNWLQCLHKRFVSSSTAVADFVLPFGQREASKPKWQLLQMCGTLVLLLDIYNQTHELRLNRNLVYQFNMHAANLYPARPFGPAWVSLVTAHKHHVMWQDELCLLPLFKSHHEAGIKRSC